MSSALRRFGALLVLVVAGASAAHAQPAADYPSRVIRVVVPFPPGTATDFLARTVAQKLSDRLGQQVIVENRPGAGGLIGGDNVAKAQPDGYTLAVISPSHLLAPLIKQSPPYRALEDFTAITQLATMPDVITVSSTLNVKTVADLVSLGKSRPGALNFGSPGIGSAAHLAAEKLKRVAGIDAVHVPYRSLSDLFADLATGRIQFNIAPLAASMPIISAGQVRPIAVGGEQRAAVLPEVPTMIESGYAGYRSETWFGVIAPAGLPGPIVGLLNTHITHLIEQPDV